MYSKVGTRSRFKNEGGDLFSRKKEFSGDNSLSPSRQKFFQVMLREAKHLKLDRRGPFDKLRAGCSLRQERSVQDDGFLRALSLRNEELKARQ
jgi:hypothetical protein